MNENIARAKEDAAERKRFILKMDKFLQEWESEGLRNVITAEMLLIMTHYNNELCAYRAAKKCKAQIIADKIVDDLAVEKYRSYSGLVYNAETRASYMRSFFESLLRR